MFSNFEFKYLKFNECIYLLPWFPSHLPGPAGPGGAGGAGCPEGGDGGEGGLAGAGWVAG